MTFISANRQTRVHRVPERTLKANRVVAPFLGGYEADVFRMLRTRLLKRLAERNAKTLGICSAREGEGKSMVALNLAISLSLDVNHTVLLVELDLRRPSLHKYLDLKVEKGLADVLTGSATLPECMVNLGYERLVLLPARTSLPRSSETIASPAMAQLAQEIRNRYPDRLIIYDLPPVLVTDDCIAFTRHLDACLFVIADGKTTKPELDRALSLIEPDKLVGTVLNGDKFGQRPKYYYANR